MAEREGFEPSVEVSPHTRLAGERLQPARPSLRIYIDNVAEGVGFEPTELLHSTVFKTAALNHSAIPPKRNIITMIGRSVNIFCSGADM